MNVLYTALDKWVNPWHKLLARGSTSRFAQRNEEHTLNLVALIIAHGDGSPVCLIDFFDFYLGSTYDGPTLTRLSRIIDHNGRNSE